MTLCLQKARKITCNLNTFLIPVVCYFDSLNLKIARNNLPNGS